VDLIEVYSVDGIRAKSHEHRALDMQALHDPLLQRDSRAGAPVCGVQKMLRITRTSNMECLSQSVLEGKPCADLQFACR
jgi:hypothetical protein